MLEQSRARLFLPQRTSRPSAPIPFSPLLSPLGVNLQPRDQAAEQQRHGQQMGRFADATRQTTRRRARLLGPDLSLVQVAKSPTAEAAS